MEYTVMQLLRCYFYVEGFFQIIMFLLLVWMCSHLSFETVISSRRRRRYSASCPLNPAAVGHKKRSGLPRRNRIRSKKGGG